MPPTGVHFNGSINLADRDEVFDKLAGSVGALAHAYPDGETDAGWTGQDPVAGNRRYWIWVQVPSLQEALGEPEIVELFGDPFPQFSLKQDPGSIEWGNLGYADEYIASYQRFAELKDAGRSRTRSASRRSTRRRRRR